MSYIGKNRFWQHTHTNTRDTGNKKFLSTAVKKLKPKKKEKEDKRTNLLTKKIHF